MKVEVFGLLRSECYHIARCCAEDLYKAFPNRFEKPKIQFMLECDWDQYIERKKIELKGETWAYNDPVMCFVDGNTIGNHSEFLQWSEDKFNYEDFRPESLYLAMAEEMYCDFFKDSEHKFVFMDIAINDQIEGRLLFELFHDVCPKTCDNFFSLCTGEKGRLASGLNLHYKGTPVHRIVPKGWIQAGDILHGRGNGGESIYGPLFEDENFAIPHSNRGLLGMANKGTHTNGSQFYITLQATPWMDCKYVCFGKLIEGTDLLKRLEDLPTFNERPKHDCRIKDCGEFDPDKSLSQ